MYVYLLLSQLFLLQWHLFIKRLCIENSLKLDHYRVYYDSFVATYSTGVSRQIYTVFFAVVTAYQSFNNIIKLIQLSINGFFIFKIIQWDFFNDMLIILYWMNFIIIFIIVIDYLLRVFILYLFLMVSFKVFDVGPSEFFILSNYVSHGIIVDLVLLYKLMHGHLVDVIVVNDRNSILVSHSFVSLLVSLSFTDFLFVGIENYLHTIDIVICLLFHYNICLKFIINI